MKRKKLVDITKNDEPIKLKDLITYTKVLSTFGLIFNTVFGIFVTVYCVVTSIDLFSFDKDTLLNNKLVVGFITRLNSYTNEELVHLFETNDIFEIFIFEVLLPSLAIVAVLFALVYACKKALDLIKDVKDNASLFTKEKLKIVKSIRGPLDVVILFIFIDFNIRGVILYLIIVLLIEYVVYLFDKCVKNNEK